MKKDEIKIKIEEYLDVLPSEIYIAKVVKSGTGAVLPSFKRYIGQEAVVIMSEKIRKQIKKEKKDRKSEEALKKQFEEDMESASWK